MLLLLKFCFTSTETVGLLGAEAQDVHLDFHTAPGLCVVARLAVPASLNGNRRELANWGRE